MSNQHCIKRIRVGNNGNTNTLSSPAGPSEDLTMLATALHAITITPDHHNQQNQKSISQSATSSTTFTELENKKIKNSKIRATLFVCGERVYRFGRVSPDRTSDLRVRSISGVCDVTPIVQEISTSVSGFPFLLKAKEIKQ